MKAVQITDPVAYHGEGPCWSLAWGGLRWVDMFAGDVLSLSSTDGGVSRMGVGELVAAIRPRDDGTMVMAQRRGFAIADTYLGDLWSVPDVRMNDGGCDPDGRFYCGSMGGPGEGALYRLNPDRTVDVVVTGVTVSNGLAWFGDRAYYVDTPTNRIDVFDYVAGSLVNRRPFVSVDSPDGLTVDALGNVWVALWGGSAVHCYAPSGALVERVELPVSKVTACTFGGPSLDRLYITTSRLESDAPLAGALFVVEPGVKGLPEFRYSG
ncbi:SMP-30/gluconolactonase/LRE family protein [Allorhizocola rhizosphaerae]|uniref:SMP-30/gluconolactonase/LRE family protein n=1 Tax=Allorhizocola rhizosphaerae TaxID=1872709 RepID=UPI000E3E7026|nr:SMP-30/gluconolactonase/LRE family protein [Allorhizocola rhizosphaerae]